MTAFIIVVEMTTVHEIIFTSDAFGFRSPRGIKDDYAGFSLQILSESLSI